MLNQILALSAPNVLLLASSLVILYQILAYLADPIRSIPGPFVARFTRLWYLYKIYRGDFERTNIALHERYGPIVRIAPNEYSIDDVSAAKTIYGHGNNFVKAPWYWAWMPPDPEKASLFADLNPHRHATQRRKFASAYSMSSLVTYEPFVNNCTSLLIKRFQSQAKSNTPIDLAHWFQCYAFDVIGEITFGRRFGFLDEGIDKDGVFAAIDSRTSYSTFVGVFPSLHAILFPLLPKSGGHAYVGNYTRASIASSQEKSQLFSSSSISPTSSNTSPFSKAEPEEEEERNGPPDFVSKFLAIHSRDPAKMTPLDIFTISQSNIGAGSDTTSITLSSILYHLLTHPKTFTRLRTEIDDGVASGAISTPITFKESTELPYLQAVIKEALRMHSATGLPLARIVPPEGAEIAGRKFPGGATVGINSWVAHRNRSVYGDDVERWRPERWLDYSEREGRGSEGAERSTEKGADMERYFFAFGMGSRTCIGKNLSLLEVGKLIPEIVRRFDFEMDGKGDVRTETGNGKADGEWKTKSRWFVKPLDFSARVKEREV